jgi:hypothetical protein
MNYEDIFQKPLIPKAYYIKLTDGGYVSRNDCFIQFLNIIDQKGRDYFEYIDLDLIIKGKGTKKQLFKTVYGTKKVSFIPITEDAFKNYLKQHQNA